MTKLKRAYSVQSILSINHKEIPLEGKWKDHIGVPERSGVWFVWGNSGNGKSSYIMQMVKELSKHGKVVFNDLEEGVRLSMKNNIIREGLDKDPNVKKNFRVLNKEPMEELAKRLRRHKSPHFIIINSWQYTGLDTEGFVNLINEFSHKLFIIISHADGTRPEGASANRVHYHADVKVWVEGFKAFPVSRYEGMEKYTIWSEGASEYWMNLK